MWNLSSQNCLIAVGLAVDILGAIVLLVPDLPFVAEWFRFGRLRAAQHSIDHGGLRAGDVGFNDVVDLFDAEHPNIKIKPEYIQQIEYGPRPHFVTESFRTGTEGMMIPPPEDDPDYLGIHLINQISCIPNQDADFPDNFPLQEGRFTRPTDHIYPDIIQTIRQGERRFRIAGLILIGGGFALQLLAVLIG